MNSVQKITNLMTVCRRAGKLVLGFDAVCDSVKNGKAFCVMTASDISANTLKEISFICNKFSVKIIPLDVSREQFLQLLGKTTVAVAVCDKGFADRFLQLSDL